MKCLALFTALILSTTVQASNRQFRSADIKFDLSYIDVGAQRVAFDVAQVEVRFSNEGFCAFYVADTEIPCLMDAYQGVDWYPWVKIKKEDFVNLLDRLIADDVHKQRAIDIVSKNDRQQFTLIQFRDIEPDKFYTETYPTNFVDPGSLTEAVDLKVSSGPLRKL